MNKIELEQQIVNVHELMHHTIRLFSYELETKKLQLTVESTAQCTTVLADPGRLQQGSLSIRVTPTVCELNALQFSGI